MTHTDKKDSLIPEVNAILCHRATEPPGTCTYSQPSGTALCRRCGYPLFHADHQINTHCGWPSFDSCIPEHVIEQLDADGQRVEILCQQCQGHLGHVFRGEGFSNKNTRHCVNGLALDWSAHTVTQATDEILLAGGCFWGIEHHMQQQTGVVKTEVGYCGGHTDYPTYDQVCHGDTGHQETVRVVFDTSRTNMTTLIGEFFACHDPYQTDGQGVDRGQQYMSVLFYHPGQQRIMEEQLQQLPGEPATQIKAAKIFWPAEKEHQQYLQRQQK